MLVALGGPGGSHHDFTLSSFHSTCIMGGQMLQAGLVCHWRVKCVAGCQATAMLLTVPAESHPDRQPMANLICGEGGGQPCTQSHMCTQSCANRVDQVSNNEIPYSCSTVLLAEVQKQHSTITWHGGCLS